MVIHLCWRVRGSMLLRLVCLPLLRPQALPKGACLTIAMRCRHHPTPHRELQPGGGESVEPLTPRSYVGAARKEARHHHHALPPSPHVQRESGCRWMTSQAGLAATHGHTLVLASAWQHAVRARVPAAATPRKVRASVTIAMLCRHHPNPHRELQPGRGESVVLLSRPLRSGVAARRHPPIIMLLVIITVPPPTASARKR